MGFDNVYHCKFASCDPCLTPVQGAEWGRLCMWGTGQETVKENLRIRFNFPEKLQLLEKWSPCNTNKSLSKTPNTAMCSSRHRLSNKSTSVGLKIADKKCGNATKTSEEEREGLVIYHRCQKFAWASLCWEIKWIGLGFALYQFLLTLVSIDTLTCNFRVE